MPRLQRRGGPCRQQAPNYLDRPEFGREALRPYEPPQTQISCHRRGRRLCHRARRFTRRNPEKHRQDGERGRSSRHLLGHPTRSGKSGGQPHHALLCPVGHLIHHTGRRGKRATFAFRIVGGNRLKLQGFRDCRSRSGSSPAQSKAAHVIKSTRSAHTAAGAFAWSSCPESVIPPAPQLTDSAGCGRHWST